MSRAPRLLERLARAADAGGERAAIALRLVGEGAEHALHRVGQRRRATAPPSRRRCRAAGRRPRPGRSPRPPRISRANPLRARRAPGRRRCAPPSNSPSRRRARSRDDRAARRASPAISVGRGRRRGSVELVAFAVAAIVEARSTRRPSRVSVSTQRGLTQLTRWLEAKPWISRIGSPRSRPCGATST